MGPGRGAKILRTHPTAVFVLLSLLVTLGLGAYSCRARRPAKDFVFSKEAFEAALVAPYDRDRIKEHYRRPVRVPLRKQTLRYRHAPTLALGEKIFKDTRLATAVGMGCVTCHQPDISYSDHKGQSAESTRRRSMTLHNLAWADSFTWDGGSGSLMSQAVLALGAPGGMATDGAALVARLSSLSEYSPLFAAAYVGPTMPGGETSFARAMWAIEVFVSSLVSGESTFDRWLRGDSTAISESAARGFDLFNTKAGCARCHMSWRFTDDTRHDLGLAEEVSVQPPNRKFKTPGLREVSLRWPYMHDGSLAVLRDVLDFYNRGGGISRPTKSPLLLPGGLSPAELGDLESFLRTLTATEPVAH